MRSPGIHGVLMNEIDLIGMRQGVKGKFMKWVVRHRALRFVSPDEPVLSGKKVNSPFNISGKGFL